MRAFVAGRRVLGTVVAGREGLVGGVEIVAVVPVREEPLGASGADVSVVRVLA
ncbi:hypothetical protein [Cryptosporangium sp. NPDC048952]|uniref:hypothetical protein n=1 Tax=Cryptosporangium sp. NPDC048952 TaxID=3363961 RepID=UPI00371668ED